MIDRDYEAATTTPTPRHTVRCMWRFEVPRYVMLGVSDGSTVAYRWNSARCANAAVGWEQYYCASCMGRP